MEPVRGNSDDFRLPTDASTSLSPGIYRLSAEVISTDAVSSGGYIRVGESGCEATIEVDEYTSVARVDISFNGTRPCGMSADLESNPPPSPTPPAPDGLIQLAPDAIRTLAADNLRARDGYAQFGPLVASATDTGIDVLDLERQTRTEIYTTGSDERILWLDIDDETIVWAVGQYDENSDRVPCDYGGGLDWRIMVHSITTGSQTTAASGRHVRQMGCGAWYPVVAVDSDLFAYSQESNRPGEWQIIVQSMSSGEVARTISAAHVIVDVDIDGTDVAYTTADVEDPSSPYFTMTQVRLLLSTESQSEATVVDRIDSPASFADGRLAWGTREGSLRQCWTATVDDLRPVQISDDNYACGAPETAGGLVQYATASDTYWFGNIWDERDGITLRFDTGMWAERLSGNGGWLVWYGEQNDDGDLIPLVQGLPLSELPGLAP
jgi:hypothetical protein